MIITLSGLAGAGKSTVKHLLAERLGMKKYSVGDMRGKMAEARGMTIDEFNKLGETEAFTDKDVDAFQEKLGQTEDNFVIDGWLSWHFIPQSVKIFLSVDPAIGAERVFEDRKNNPNRADEPLYSSVKDAENVIEKRLESNISRYEKWYGVDFQDPSHYDLVIDTSRETPISVVEKS
ncbi:MAG: cytidylate kinase family protein [Patescibacteria group bacterium]|jgi:predicted cytidylate kinase